MPTYHLTELIVALSKEEIRNFKLYSSRIHSASEDNSKTLKLFDHIKSGKFDEFSDALVKNLYKSSNKNAFYRLKNRLINDIEQSLLLLNRNKDERFKVYNIIQLAQIFRYKSEYVQSFNYLKKGKKLAIKHQYFDLLDTIYTEILNLAADYYKIDPEVYIKAKRENFKHLGRKQETDFLLATLNFRLRSSNYSYKDTDIEEMLQVLIGRLELDENISEDVVVRFNVFKLIATDLLQKRNIPVLEEYLLNGLKEYEGNGYFIQHQFEDKFWVLHWIINCLHINNKLKEAAVYLNTLEESLDKNGGKYRKKNIWRLHESQVVHFSFKNDVNKSIELLEKISNDSELIGTNFYDIFVNLNLALSYYKMGKLSQSMDNLAPIIISKSLKNLPQSLQLNIAILDVILHYENQDYSFVDYRINEIKRVFRQVFKDVVFEREKEFISILRLLNNTSGDFNNSKVAAKTELYLEKYKQLPRGENEGIIYPIWLEAKRAKKEYFEVIGPKVQAAI